MLTAPPADRDGAVDWVRQHLGDLTMEGPAGVDASEAFRGGQRAADAALAGLDLHGYARRRSVIDPDTGRGASRLSPYVRHGLLPLPDLWTAARAAPPGDRDRFRDELLWQEYARHLYARTGGANALPLRYAPPYDPASPTGPAPDPAPDPERIWPLDMECMRASREELERDGWLVNQARMWLASQWTVRHGGDLRAGDDQLYRRLIDGSRAANRLGWQWVAGTLTGKAYGFSRWQVEKRAPALCRRCPLRRACPVQEWPPAQAGRRLDDGPELGRGPTPAGPAEPERTGTPHAVWLTAESLGDGDPALAANPQLPAVFVFDEPLLARLRLVGKRLVFLAETLAQLGAEVRLGDPATELSGRRLAATWTYVPGWKRRAAQLDLVAVHPWPWVRRPGGGSLRSYSAWVRSASR